MASNTPRPTKAERRAAARAKAQALREEQERRERRLKITRRALLGGGVVAAVGATAALVVASRRNAVAGDPRIPKGVGDDGSLTYGAAMTPGSVNEGAPVLDVYFDYACHFCANLDVAHAEEFSTLVAEKRITLVFQPAKILGQAWTDWCMTAVGLALGARRPVRMDSGA